jgi:hypothetical protein
MYRTLKIIFAITPLICLTGCSWQEYFVIRNTSRSEVIVQYEIEPVEKGFPIFTDQPLLYKLDRSKGIDWSTKQIPSDLDTSPTGLKLKLPANYVVVFGELNNDHYTVYNQDFINARVFNLKELEIRRHSDTLRLVPANFDASFKKTAGNITLEIK